MKIKFLICSIVLMFTAINCFAADKGYVLRETIWDSSTIPVCWDDLTESTEVQRGWVQAAVARTWEANSAVRFVGWGQCTTGAPGIHIAVRDVGPYVVALGDWLDGVDGGMVLNFTYNNWSAWFCVENAQYCSDVIAVHEFGHALGFAHEQNRPDTPSSCTQDPQGTSGDTIVGEWDLDSVMNYCNPAWNGDGNLSETDIEMVQRFYPSSPNGTQQCNWYGTIYPLCVTTTTGWGFENEKSCISRSTCSGQPAPFGVVEGGSSSRSASSVSSSSSSQRSLSSSLSSASNFSSSRSSSSSSLPSVSNCQYILSSEWDGGFSAVIRLTNNRASAINGWSVNWAYTDGSRITSSWNTVLAGSNPYTATNLNAEWSAIIPPGQFFDFGVHGTKGNAASTQIPVLSGGVCD